MEILNSVGFIGKISVTSIRVNAIINLKNIDFVYKYKLLGERMIFFSVFFSRTIPQV